MDRTEHIIERPVGDDPWGPKVTTKGALSRPGSSRSQTLKIACRSCNNGWMKRIVDNSIPILKKIGEGHWELNSKEEQLALATWITLFSMSYEFADKETVCVSEYERRAFAKSSVPSGHWRLAIGYVESTPGREVTLHRAMRIHPDIEWDGHRKSQITCFVFGLMIAFAYYAEFSTIYEFEWFARANGLAPLWPLPNDLRKPLRVHSDESVNELIQVFSMTFK